MMDARIENSVGPAILQDIAARFISRAIQLFRGAIYSKN